MNEKTESVPKESESLIIKILTKNKDTCIKKTGNDYAKKYGAFFAITWGILFLITFFFPNFFTGEILCSGHPCFPLWLILSFPGFILSVGLANIFMPFLLLGKVTTPLFTLVLVYILGHTTGKIVHRIKLIAGSKK